MALSKPLKLLDLANEILTEIASHVENKNQTRLMQTCHILHSITARMLYRDLHPSIDQTRSLCLTLLSGSPTRERPYAHHVRSFTFEAINAFDIVFKYRLVVESLVAMINLRSLTLLVNGDWGDDIINPLKTSRIIRHRMLTKPIDAFTFDPHPRWSNNALPFLENLSFCGDIRIAGIAQHRRLRSLIITVVLTSDEVRELASMVTLDSKPNTSLKTLQMVTEAESAADYLSHLQLLACTFPKLTTLSYGSPNLNALVCDDPYGIPSYS